MWRNAHKIIFVKYFDRTCNKFWTFCTFVVENYAQLLKFVSENNQLCLSLYTTQPHWQPLYSVLLCSTTLAGTCSNSFEIQNAMCTTKTRPAFFFEKKCPRENVFLKTMFAQIRFSHATPNGSVAILFS